MFRETCLVFVAILAVAYLISAILSNADITCSVEGGTDDCQF